MSIHTDYFNNIVSNLSCGDVEILGVLSEMNAVSIFKSVGNQTVFKQCRLTEAKYRNTINRLIALDFIRRSPTSGKEHLLYLSPYGSVAFELFMDRVSESEVV